MPLSRRWRNAEGDMPGGCLEGGHRKGDTWRVCDVCGKGFWGNPMQRYCSSECRYESTKARARKYYRATKGLKPGDLITKKCVVCGREFQSLPSKKTRFCSSECREKAGRRTKRDPFAMSVIEEWVSGERGEE